MNHVLTIKSLRDLDATCSCGKWSMLGSAFSLCEDDYILARANAMHAIHVGTRRKVETWAMTDSELANPAECTNDDMLLMLGDGDGDDPNVYILRNGRDANQYGDGASGVTRKDKRAARKAFTLQSRTIMQESEPNNGDNLPEPQPANQFRKVHTEDGRFMRFLRVKS